MQCVCGEFISEGGEGAGVYQWYHNNIQYAAAAHSCGLGKMKFPYDFNSPLTIKEQFEAWKTKH
jgi:hypothetical protein